MNVFRNTFAENIFKLKYAKFPEETWAERAKDIVEDVCGTQWGKSQALMCKDDRDQLEQYVREMKFLPGGRYIWYAGRGHSYFNNCFSRDTRFITDEGIRSFKDFYDDEQIKVLSPITKQFVEAVVHSYGEQDLYEITFQNLRGKSTKQWKVKATKHHRWPLKTGQITENLQEGDVVLATGLGPDEVQNITADFTEGVKHGMVFADGNLHVLKNSYSHQLRLCKTKRQFAHLFEEDHTITYPEFALGDPVVYIKSPTNLKGLPAEDSSLEYIKGFLRGWLELDGYDGTVKQIHSINKKAIEYFCEWSWLCSFVVTGNVREDDSPTNFGVRNNTLYFVNYTTSDNFAGFKVVGIQPIGREEVWCVVEPQYHQFTLEHGMVTGNCFLLRAEEDTREEWGALMQRSVSCLMTGGGIGVDYSILRPKGSPLSKTGGVASGPLPLMQMVNEAGRGVMQGGSRRSAIYASLNWQHKDIHDFLVVKNWDEQTKAAKANNFNAPAPLDMTNISVNYDDASLGKVVQYDDFGKELSTELASNPVFLQNVRQAMETGEPGFSFNFGDKQNETLRNACTEVTSEDDSDVCNLGSINMGNITSLAEFQSVVSLASKFLVCGTLRADLPYDKVYKVREKNRRLGLGLMGIHEWLLKRGHGYEVVPELHEWLKVYQQESERAANEHCDRFYISRPVAYRAIAPTGSIGILAGTTTGIEPLFAVAYKRRFLSEGTKWKYQYVVDGTAATLIKDFGVNPNKIESAIDLSSNYEQRISFQAAVQDYVDMSISSTINLDSWGSETNNESTVEHFTEVLAKYAPHLRGFTCYPNGARGGQPLTAVGYEEALSHKNNVYEESMDICELTGGGTCGV